MRSFVHKDILNRWKTFVAYKSDNVTPKITISMIEKDIVWNRHNVLIQIEPIVDFSLRKDGDHFKILIQSLILEFELRKKAQDNTTEPPKRPTPGRRVTRPAYFVHVCRKSKTNDKPKLKKLKQALLSEFK